MVFNTKYDKRAPVYQEPGSRERIVYSPRYSETGVLDLVVTGKENLYEYIQSHKESTDIHYLLNRFVNGETDVLSRMQGFYADVTSMPKTYAEVLNAVIAGEEHFARLPVDVKQRFDNSFSVWLSSFDSPDFAEKMGFKAESTMSDSQVQDFSSPRPTPAGVSAGAQDSSAPPAPLSPLASSASQS